MSVDFENRLRDDLASVPLDIPVDVGATLAAGRRARGRRISLVTGAVALVTALGLVAVPLLNGRTIPAVPEPIQTPTATRATVTFADGMGMGPDATGIEAGATVRVERVATAAGAQLQVDVSVTPRGGSLIQESFTRPERGAWAPFAVDGFIFVSVLPGAPVWADTVNGEAFGGGTWDTRELEGMQLSVLLFVADHSPAQLAGVVWQGADGQVRNNLGDDVASVEITLEALAGVVYADPRLDRIGWQFDGGATSAHLSDLGSDYLALASGHSSDQGPSTMRSLFLLPAGAHDAEVVPSQLPSGVGTFDTTSLSVPLTGGEYAGRMVVLVASVLPDGVELSDVSSQVASLSFVDANGQRVTVTPEPR